MALGQLAPSCKQMLSQEQATITPIAALKGTKNRCTQKNGHQ